MILHCFYKLQMEDDTVTSGDVWKENTSHLAVSVMKKSGKSGLRIGYIITILMVAFVSLMAF